MTSFGPVAAATAAPIRLAMQRLWLTGSVLAAGARLVVQHVFRSDEDHPVEVIYAFMLPRDAALRAFRITGEGFEAHSELRPTEEAVKAYEKGIAEGSLSTLARQYGDGVVNLTVGNLRPRETVTVYLEILAGVELRDDGFRFRFPFTLAPAYHQRMRAAVVDGEGEWELPADEFGDVMLPRFRKDASELHEVGFDLSMVHTLPLEEVGSSSHAVKVKYDGTEPARVALAPAKDVPNRDLVLDVKFKQSRAQVLAGPVEDGKRDFAVVAPSTVFGRNPEEARRVVILLDRSGSMAGEPILQAKKAIEASLAALSDEDSFGLMAFDDSAEAMHAALVPATREQRELARAFLKQTNARGGTELAKAAAEAAKMLAGSGDIIVLTDGQVAGTEKILQLARSSGVRISCLGIGSASQDRFLALLARETGGVGRFVTAAERVDLAAVDLFASIGSPVASGLSAGANVQPAAPHAVFAGVPVLLFGEDAGEGIGLNWTGGSVHFDVPEGDAATGEAVRLLRGARMITDWESRYPSEEALAPLEKRQQSRVAGRLLELSKQYRLASREMSLVAVIKRTGDRGGELPEVRVVPVGMPQGTPFHAYFHGPASVVACSAFEAQAPLMSRRRVGAARPEIRNGASMPDTPAYMRMMVTKQPAPGADGNDDLVELAAMLEADGGMPGNTPGIRAARSAAAVFAFVQAGHTLTAGAFRLHLIRLAGYLRSLTAGSAEEKRMIETALAAASSGSAPVGGWVALSGAAGTGWREIEAAMR